MLKIKEDKMQELEKFGYQQSSKIIYPRCLEKCVGDMLYIRIYNDKPCINIWDGEDKNQTREIWLENDKNGFDTSMDEKVEPYIQDLIKSDMVEKDGEQL